MNRSKARQSDGNAEVSLTPLTTFSGLKHVLAYDDLAPIRLSHRLGYRLTFAPLRGWRDFTASFASREKAAKAVAVLVDFGARPLVTRPSRSSTKRPWRPPPPENGETTAPSRPAMMLRRPIAGALVAKGPSFAEAAVAAVRRGIV